MYDRDVFARNLKEMLGEKRLRHSICVEARAAELAARHGCDVQKAATAGLLHDICHDMPKGEQLKYLQTHGILLDIFTQGHPTLWHALCAAVYIAQTLRVDDADIISAVRYHTTGRGGMSILEKVVYIADATSADRQYPGVEPLRRAADDSLDQAMLMNLSFEISKLAVAKKTIARDAWEAYNEFAILSEQGKE